MTICTADNPYAHGPVLIPRERKYEQSWGPLQIRKETKYGVETLIYEVTTVTREKHQESQDAGSRTEWKVLEDAWSQKL